MRVQGLSIGLAVAAVAIGVGVMVRMQTAAPPAPGSTQPTAEAPAGGTMAAAAPHPQIPLQTDTVAVPPERIYRFANVQGPATTTTVTLPGPTPLSRYGHGGASRLAILVTDPQANWLGLAHGLKSLGVPFVMTQDAQEALAHRVVMVYPLISGRVLTADALKTLAAHPRNGGTIIGSDVLGGGLEEVFGFEDSRPAQDRYALQFAAGVSLLADFTDPAEQVIPLGNRAKGMVPIATRAYLRTKEPPLATFEDGTAAITQRSYGVGHAYAIGLDLGHLLLKGHNLRDEGIARSYDNRYEPVLDVFLRLLKAIYEKGEPDAVQLHPVPQHRQMAVMLTHDIDAQTSMANARQFAEYERSQGIVGTYFVQTKYIKDYNDEIFFNAQGVQDMRVLHQLGMELGSHTVAHSKVLSHFPLGTGTERYPDYLPYVKTRNNAANGSILGELRVSQYLVEQLSGGAKVRSFRPGELSNPKALPQALTATGYRYSSSATANNSLTHLPYQLMISRDVDTESEIFEFPVTIEDEELPEMGSRVPEALAVATKIARYGGSVVVLIHPNILGHKMEFERAFVSGVKDRAWFGSLGQYGDWWAARDRVEVDVRTVGARKVVTVSAPQKIAGLTLQIPQTWTLASKERDARVTSSGPGFVVLGKVQGPVELTFTVSAAQVAALSAEDAPSRL